MKADPKTLYEAYCWADQFERTGEALRGSASDHNRCKSKATGEEVFDMLIAPLRSKIRNRRLILVPHHQLHYIPFAALRDPDTGDYLVEDYVLTYAPSASTLHFFKERRNTTRGTALILGNPETSGAAVSLEGASCEAVSVAGTFGTTPLLGPRATESSLYHLGGKTSLVHIAAHGSYNAANPLSSAVSLAKSDDKDGVLYVREILSDVDMTGVNLVVLSACSTAAGGHSGGDEVVGLTRALLYAGSAGVISTLWNISDQAAAQLMEEFYQRFLAGAPAAEALHDAQIAMIRNADYGDPAYWAAFNLTGDPQVRWNPDP